MDAYVGLVAAMCCIGACYSLSIPADHARQLMDLVSSAIEKSSHTFLSVSPNAPFHVKFDSSSFDHTAAYLEKLQAIILVQILFTWHGTAAHREKALRDWPLVASVARNANLICLFTDETLRSPAHQAEFGLISFPPATQFEWTRWIEQEKRIRTLYLIFIYDATLGLYFNRFPQFDPFEIDLPLPADDAVWDATTQLNCAEALGFYGHNIARARNPGGTHGSSRPGLRSALNTLLGHCSQLQSGTINWDGKFILIHALLQIMRQAQLRDSANFVSENRTYSPSNSWLIGSTGAPTLIDSACATPVDIGDEAIQTQMQQNLLAAFEKFKMVWDWDTRVQLPPSGIANFHRHWVSENFYFYWLVKHLVKHTRIKDLQMTSDQRFVHIACMVKWVKNWVLTYGASHEEELGSFGEVGEDSLVEGMTLDMTMFFQPLPMTAKPPGYSTAHAQGGNRQYQKRFSGMMWLTPGII